MDERRTSNLRRRAGGARRAADTKAVHKASFVKRAWRGLGLVAGSPSAAVGMEEVRQGARYIRGLSELLRSGAQPGQRLLVHAGGTLDVTATAFAHGLSVDELERRLAIRRRQTATAAYVAFGLGWFFVVLWLWQALSTPMSFRRILSALEFIPFCAVFFLLAFRSAWLNWQLRARRLGSAAEYVRSSEPFWSS